MALKELALKPCPFCGGEAGLFNGQVDGGDIGLDAWYVGCKTHKCMAQGPLGKGRGDVGQVSAVYLWNRRV